MIVAFHRIWGYKVGDVATIGFNPVKNEKIEPEQPCVILKEVTKQDYIDYWKGEIAIMPSDGMKFFLISTD